MQYIFQDPYASLDPRMTVSDIVAKHWIFIDWFLPKKRGGKSQRAVKMVGLNTEHASVILMNFQEDSAKESE